MKLSNLKTVITRTAGRTGLVLKKYSPEILIGTGVVAIAASTILCCKATLKVDEILNEHKEQVDKIHHVAETKPEKYSDQDKKKDLTTTYVQTGVKFVKLYGPGVSLGLAGISCMLAAHGIMKKRNVALLAAYNAIEKSYSDYRNRVVEEYCEVKDREFKNGIKAQEVEKTITDKDGKTKTIKETADILDPNKLSIYAREFNQSSHQWNEIPEYNLIFLKAQQNYANDLLHARGHVFLNEVYDMLGIPRSQAGSIVGWVLGEGNSFIDFGIYELRNSDFVNGQGYSAVLDFNVAGVIYDLI